MTHFRATKIKFLEFEEISEPATPFSNFGFIYLDTLDDKLKIKKDIGSTITLEHPLTTKGDLIGYDGTDTVRLPAGTNGHVLTLDSGETAGFKWEDPSTNVVSTLATVLVRRTLTFTNGGSFVDVTFDATDVETDASVIEHDNTNTDRIVVKENGTYMMTYTVLADDASIRVRINDTTIISGSENDSVLAASDFSTLSVSIPIQLVANDYITMQSSGTTDLTGTIIMGLYKMDGIKGNAGAAGPSGDINWQGAWNSGTSYVINDTIESNGSSYVATANNSNDQPPSANWDLVASAGNTGASGDINWQGVWSSLTSYVVNDTIESDGSSYIATSNNTNDQPPSANWDLVAAKGVDAAVTSAAAIQVRRTTNFVVAAGFADVPFDETSIETDTSVIEHDNIDTDRINLKVAGVYLIAYAVETARNTIRVRVNDTTVLGGTTMTSELANNDFSTSSGFHLGQFSANDYISLQASGTVDLQGEIILWVSKIEGVTGPVGPTGPSGDLNWLGAWDSGTTYLINDTVESNGSSYVTTTTNSNDQPPSSNWDLVAAAGAAGASGDLNWLGAWSSLTSYVINDTVQSDGSSYVAISNNTNDQPPSANWDLVAAKGDTGPTPVFGSELSQVVDNTISTTTSATYQNKLTITTGSLPAGTYRIDWSYQWAYDEGTTDFLARVQLDNSTNYMEHRQEPKDTAGTGPGTGTNQAHQTSGFYIDTTLSGVHTIDLDWAAGNAGVISSIWNARLMIYRIA